MDTPYFMYQALSFGEESVLPVYSENTRGFARNLLKWCEGIEEDIRLLSVFYDVYP